jgi:hypothetical protein
VHRKKEGDKAERQRGGGAAFTTGKYAATTFLRRNIPHSQNHALFDVCMMWEGAVALATRAQRVLTTDTTCPLAA